MYNMLNVNFELYIDNELFLSPFSSRHVTTMTMEKRLLSSNVNIVVTYVLTVIECYIYPRDIGTIRERYEHYFHFLEYPP